MINKFNKHSINGNKCTSGISPSAENDLFIAQILLSLIKPQTFIKILSNHLLTLYKLFHEWNSHYNLQFLQDFEEKGNNVLRMSCIFNV